MELLAKDGAVEGEAPVKQVFPLLTVLQELRDSLHRGPLQPGPLSGALHSPLELDLDVTGPVLDVGLSPDLLSGRRDLSQQDWTPALTERGELLRGH